MELGSPVIIISAFGRGHWLAASLAHEGIKTTLVDVSSKLGVWPIEDIEGPFGFFRNEKISESQLERLYADDPFVEVPEGFTLWLKDGPLECKGPTSRFRLEKLKLHPSVQEFLFSSETTNKALYKNASSFSFDQSWLWQFAHQWAGSTYAPNARAVKTGQALPLFSSFLVRGSTRSGLEKSFQWLESKGVEVLRPHQIVDASFGSGKSVTGLELSGEKQGLFRLEQIVWMLSSEETYFMNERLGKYFFPEGALESEWCWVRYRVGMQACFERDSLPLHTVLLEDVESPWTHENMMVLQRTSLPDQFDVWMRIPTVQRFNKEYLTAHSEHMRALLLARMPLAQSQILNFPQEYYYTYAQLGSPRHPIFAEEKSSRRGKTMQKNLHVGGPEVWANYSWGAYFENDELIRQEISNWWKEKLLKEQKAKRKDQDL